MNNTIRAGLVIKFLMWSLIGSVAQSYLHVQGTAIINEDQDTIILRGMGLGGWMLQEGYMLQTAEFANAQYQIIDKITELIGADSTEKFYDAWLRNHVTKADIDSLKSWGFNSVRLPMHYNLFTLPIEEELIPGTQTWLDTGFDLTDSLISWCKQNQLYVILDLHAAPGGQGQDQGISDYDPSKPSLWESQENRIKTVALWKKLAERYAGEPSVAGYDLLNEPNWNLPGNKLLAALYKEITDSIRQVDNKHIIFIEGNWFANDFTRLTPPWDDNIVYSPHKYWSINDQASIQWVLDIRKNYNVPLFFGESGENSNVWFRDAIQLFEDNGIGWAWWPMKKIESISGPLSVIKTPAYDELLNYWKGNGNTPSVETAYATLIDLTDKLRIANCIVQKDVIDAMFRQVYSQETIPYQIQSIPGIVYASEYDLGQLGKAYYDVDAANYQVSTGQFTTWNTGWTYRNDGVDIEGCSDQINSNGYNIAWIDNDEWMQYSIDVQSSALYDIRVRIASFTNGGKFNFKIGESDLTDIYEVPNTGGWQNWETMVIPDVILETQDKKLRFFADNGGFNVSSFEFIQKDNTSSIPTKFQNASTLDEYTIQLNLNKNIQAQLPSQNDFSIFVNGDEIEITDYFIEPFNARVISFNVNSILRFNDVIKISYSGNQIMALDGTRLLDFTLRNVRNSLPVFFEIPGKLEVEDYFFQSGIQLESTTDVGGGSNIGFLDATDYLDYNIYIADSGMYQVNYRIASMQGNGGCQLILIDTSGEKTILNTASFPATGGWQKWETFQEEIEVPQGYYTLRLLITKGPFNINWIDFTRLDPPKNEGPIGISVFPNPFTDNVQFAANFVNPHKVTIRIYNMLGQLVLTTNYNVISSLSERINLQGLAAGPYFLEASLEDDSIYKFKLMKF